MSMSTEIPIDPALLSESELAKEGRGRGIKRKAAPVMGTEGSGSTRTRTRLASRAPRVDPMSTDAGDDVGAGSGRGKSKTKVEQGQGQERGTGEPSRGEEENLIGSEYKFRGKRSRGHGKVDSKSKSKSKSPVKKRTRLPSSKGKEKEEGGTEGMDGLANAAFDQSMPGSSIPLPLHSRIHLPLINRSFLYPCLRPTLPNPPPGDPNKSFKRFDPHEFDDPKSLLDTDSLSSDDEDEDESSRRPIVQSQTSQQTLGPSQPQAGQNRTTTGAVDEGLSGYSDGMLGVGIAGEMDYDTQAYQSLAALLEASNDGELFQSGETGGKP